MSEEINAEQSQKKKRGRAPKSAKQDNLSTVDSLLFEEDNGTPKKKRSRAQNKKSAQENSSNGKNAVEKQESLQESSSQNISSEQEPIATQNFSTQETFSLENEAVTTHKLASESAEKAPKRRGRPAKSKKSTDEKALENKSPEANSGDMNLEGSLTEQKNINLKSEEEKSEEPKTEKPLTLSKKKPGRKPRVKKELTQAVTEEIEAFQELTAIYEHDGESTVAENSVMETSTFVFDIMPKNPMLVGMDTAQTSLQLAENTIDFNSEEVKESSDDKQRTKRGKKRTLSSKKASKAIELKEGLDESLALELSPEIAEELLVKTDGNENVADTVESSENEERTESKRSTKKNKSKFGRKKQNRHEQTSAEAYNEDAQKEAVSAEDEASQKSSHSVDFVSGAQGTSVYSGPDSLGAYGEQAALGVLSAFEELPVDVDFLPLVESVDSQAHQDMSSEKSDNTDDAEQKAKPERSRSRRTRSKKRLKKKQNALQEQDNENIEPISEGGELALIEAEVAVKKQDAKEENIRRVLYVSSTPDEQVEVVITENGVVSEYFVEMVYQSKIRGNIYKGVINNVDTNLQAAFVNFGCGKNGFLQIDEVHPEYWLTHHKEGGAKYPPIQKVLRVGQEVLVQVVKEPTGSKGAFLTTWISLAGRFIVLTPGQEQIGVSRKVEDNAERARLRELLVGINPGENMGVIVRTVSEGASKTSIQKDLQFLKRTWKSIQKDVVSEKAPCLIHQEADLASRAVRDYLNDDISEVWTDSEDVYKELQDLVRVVFPRNKNVLKLHQDSRQNLWERFNISRQLDDVCKREVNLPSGGRLVFDQTEALMAIDINSGKTQGKTNFESMVFRTNMEAAESIARHLRLRDIGGQVVIDFIEMRDRSHTREVEKCLRNAMKRDRARHDVGRISSFGLLELVRQRTGTSAISLTSEPCPHCHGTGFRRNMEWQVQTILREIKSKLMSKNMSTNYVHEVDYEAGLYLLNRKRDRLCEMETQYGIKIEIRLK